MVHRLNLMLNRKNIIKLINKTAMTLVKFNNKPSNGFSLLENFFNEIPTVFRDDFGTNVKGSVPVNIKETNDAYLLDVVAPGFEKNDLTLNLPKKAEVKASVKEISVL